jgi:adenylosuccinate synthase
MSDLPPNARKYVDLVAELMGEQVSFVSIGPDRAQTIVCD